MEKIIRVNVIEAKCSLRLKFMMIVLRMMLNRWLLIKSKGSGRRRKIVIKRKVRGSLVRMRSRGDQNHKKGDRVHHLNLQLRKKRSPRRLKKPNKNQSRPTFFWVRWLGVAGIDSSSRHSWWNSGTQGW